ncbi:hypothetical protein ZHAS_00013179 [Anopheles sinensis]|uniref:Uncharacterized protein n=1 Tax=Anopheles sinensis TaxID=74873 RepID=A0A084W4R9_ANOSI|nr:hypothetical protein ZHAS_00013179 [Anopheles sinensis]
MFGCDVSKELDGIRLVHKNAMIPNDHPSRSDGPLDWTDCCNWHCRLADDRSIAETRRSGPLLLSTGTWHPIEPTRREEDV